MDEFSQLVEELRKVWRQLANLEELPKKADGDVNHLAALRRYSLINDLWSLILKLEEECQKP
tara:strand:- start:13078 stop:13263 length:186 start_codon:yes stop_codon:yes gene_type:complete